MIIDVLNYVCRAHGSLRVSSVPEGLKNMSKNSSLILGGQVITRQRMTKIWAGHLSRGLWRTSLDRSGRAGGSYWSASLWKGKDPRINDFIFLAPFFSKHMISGLVSRGRGCAQAHYPGIYTRVLHSHLGPITIFIWVPSQSSWLWKLGEDASFLDLYSCTDACEVQGEASGTRTFFRRGKNHLELTGMHARNWFWVRRSIYLIPNSHWDPVHQSFSSYPLPYLCGGNNALASSNTHNKHRVGN